MSARAAVALEYLRELGELGPAGAVTTYMLEGSGDSLARWRAFNVFDAGDGDTLEEAVCNLYRRIQERLKTV